MTGEQHALYLAALVVSALTSLAFSGILWMRRNEAGAIPAAFALLAASLWTFSSALEVSTILPETKFFWHRVELAGIVAIVLCWLWFAVEYTGRGQEITPARVARTCALPAVMLALVVTDPLHHWIWSQVDLPALGNFAHLEAEPAAGYWVIIIYLLALVAVGVGLLVQFFVSSPALYRRQILVLILAACLPTLSHLLFLIYRRPLGYIDLTPLTFPLMTIFLVWGLRHYWLFDILPLARSALVEGMDDGMAVLDDRERVIDLNYQACKTLGGDADQFSGKPIQQALSAWPELLAWWQSEPGAATRRAEVVWGSGKEQRTYDVRVSLLSNLKPLRVGRLISWRDITERRVVEDALRRQIEELGVLHSIASACVEATSEDILIERITEVIGQSLYTDNFGILLLDEASGHLKFHRSYRGLPEELKDRTIPSGQGITGRVAASGKTIRVNDVQQEEDYYHIYYDTCSELCVPVKTNCCVIGVINVESSKAGAFSASDERLISTIAGQIATAIERLRAETDERLRVDELLAITRVGREITSMLDHQQVLNSIVRHAVQISRSDASGIFTLRPDGRFNLVAWYGISDEMPTSVNKNGLPGEGTVVGRALVERRPAQIPDIWEDKSYSAGSFAAMEKIRAILALPLMRGDESIGGIVLWHRSPRRFTSEEEVFLQALAQLSVNAMENARLFEAEREQRLLAEVLREVGAALSKALDLDTVMEGLLDQVSRLVPYDAANIILLKGQYAYVARMRGYEKYNLQMAQEVANLVLDTTATANLRSLIETRRPMVISDTRQYPGWLALSAGEYFHSWAGMPILHGEQVIALFAMDKVEPGFYQDEHLKRLELFAAQARLALQNAQLFEETRRRASHLEALNKIIAAAAGARDLESLIEITLQQTLGALALPAGAIRIGEEYCTRNFPVEILTARLCQPADEDGPDQEAVLCIEDWKAEAVQGKAKELASQMLGAGVRASVTVPILSDGGQIGAIHLGDSGPRGWSIEEIGLVETIGKQLGAAVERLKLLEETRRRLEEVTLLSKVIALTTSAQDIVSALEQVCLEVASFFKTPQAGFALLNEAGTGAEVIAECSGPGRPSALHAQIPVEGNPSMAYVLAHKSPLAIYDAQNDERLAPIQDLMRMRGIGSILLVPVLLGRKVLGTLGVDTLERYEFSPADITLMQNIASQIGQALERVSLFDQARLHAQRMARLAHLSGELNRPLTVDEVVTGIGEGALVLSGAERAAVYLRLPDDQVLCPWQSGLSSAYIQGILENLTEVPGGEFAYRTEPVLLSDASQFPEKALLRRLAVEEKFRGLGLWPLVYEGQTIASVACYYNQPHTWSDNEQEVMLTFIRQAAVALQNARLFEETRRRASQQEALNAIIATAVVAPDLPFLLEAVLNLTMKALGVEKGGIWAAGQTILRGLPEYVGRDSQMAFTGHSLNLNATYPINDWDEVPAGQPVAIFKDHMAKFQVRASLTVPIMSGGRRIGGIAMGHNQPRNWLDEEMALVESVGRQLGTAIERFDLMAKTQEQARQVQQIMDTVPEGVILLDASLNIVLANPAAWQYLRMLDGDISLESPLLTLGGRSVEDLLAQYPEQPWGEVQSQFGVHWVFEVAAQPLETGIQRGGWVLVLRDVTQERENQARIQMQERLATVGQLAAGIAHDFNNIMAAIVVYADLLSMETNLTDTSRDRLTIIQQQVQRATSLIRQILDFSRRSVMEQVSLDLLPFIKELDKLLGRVLPETIQLELVYQPSTYLVKGDPTRLQQVFMNLALNARDAMPSGGTLKFEMESIMVGPEEPPPVPDLSAGRWIRIRVVDTGTGIPAELIPHIFDPFFTTKPVGQGTGLGLAQVYGIIKQHGGSLDVQSRVGEGTDFSLYLPALEPPPFDEFRGGTIHSALGRGETILIAEDDWAAREALQALLETQNFRVLAAANGVEAMNIFDEEAEQIVLVISDVVMPEMGGVDLYHELCRRRPNLKMLFITGHPLDQDDQALLEAGQVHWLQKPFSVQEFSSLVRLLLEETVLN